MTDRTLPSAFVSAGRDHMRAALSKVTRVIEKHNSIPLLSMVELRCIDDKVIAVGTDMDMLAYAEVEGALPFEGRILCPAAELYAFARKSYGQDITIQSLDDGRVRALSKPGSLTFTACGYDTPLPPPSIEGKDPVAIVGLDRADFVQALRDIAPFISSEETRYYLNGIFFQNAGDNRVRMTATDGHRLGCVTLKAGGDVEGALGDGSAGNGIIVPRKAIEYMVSVFPHQPPMIYLDAYEVEGEITKDGETTKVKTRPWVGFRVERLTLKTKLIDGTFPDYGRVVPDTKGEDMVSAVINPGKLARALAAVSLGSKDSSRAVKVEIGEKSVRLSMKQDGSHVVEAAVNSAWVKGAWKAPMGFNVRYVADAMTFGRGDVEMFMRDVGSPVVLRDVADPDRFSVLMPMKVG